MDRFDRLQEEFIRACLKRSPQEASGLGYTEWDKELPSGKLEDRQKGIEQNKMFLKRFEDLDTTLDFDQKITRDLTVHKLKIWIFLDESAEFYLKNPSVVTELSAAFQSLLQRKGSSKFYPLLARLEKAPQYIKEFESRVISPTSLWTQMAIEGVQGLSKFLSQITREARKEIPPPDAEEIENQAKNVENALKDYTKILEKILPDAVTPWALGEEKFEALLQLRGLPYTGEEILALGYKWLNQEKKTLREIAESIAPGKSIHTVMQMIKERHPRTFEEVLELSREYLKKSRQFVIDHQIVTLPEKEEIRVDETPEYMRHWLPFGAYFPPPVVGEERVGHFRLTPPEDIADLKEHNEPFTINASVHEGYPGHHVQLWCSTIHPHDLRWFSSFGDCDAKAAAESPEFIEGWAVYCEELMMEKGFNTTRAYLFAQSRFVLWRAARIIVDVQLSRGGMTFEQAVAFMEDTGMEHAGAVGEVRWFTLRPSYPLSYLLGKHMLKDLKQKVQNTMGSAFTEKFFHDTMLYQGIMPFSFFEKIFDHKLEGVHQG